MISKPKGLKGMKEYITDRAIVRVHGPADREKIEAATVIFMKKVQQKRKKERKQ